MIEREKKIQKLIKVKVYWDKRTLINIDERSVPIEEEELNMKNREREREREIGGLVLGRRQK